MNGQPPEKIVLDTVAVLRFLKKYEGTPDLGELFPDSDLFISEISEFELLSYWNITREEEASINQMLLDLVIIPLLPEIKQQGIIFRRVTRCKTPDSIIAATAIILGATLITHDTGFDKINFLGFNVMVLR
ncbi:MAG: PIN domain-containing protein [Treponema sp.]|jgi:predicted nucleic acid-binding protein|nr:PIN domain-containing protein [Treponema sp.]